MINNFRFLNTNTLPACNEKMLILFRTKRFAGQIVRYIELDNDDDDQPCIVVVQDDGGVWYIPQTDWNNYAWVQLNSLTQNVFKVLHNIQV